MSARIPPSALQTGAVHDQCDACRPPEPADRPPFDRCTYSFSCGAIKCLIRFNYYVSSSSSPIGGKQHFQRGIRISSPGEFVSRVAPFKIYMFYVRRRRRRHFWPNCIGFGEFEKGPTMSFRFFTLYKKYKIPFILEYLTTPPQLFDVPVRAYCAF